MKGTLVFRFGPNLKLKFWPKAKLNNMLLLVGMVLLALKDIGGGIYLTCTSITTKSLKESEGRYW